MHEQYQDLKERIEKLEKKVESLSKILEIKFIDKNSKEVFKNSDTQLSEVSLIPKENINHKKPSEAINLLPILAVICFGLAGVFIVKLAIDSGWLTAERQWGLLTFFGTLLLGVGVLIKKIDKTYRSYAGAAGIIILYMASYSGYLYFDIFSPVIAQIMGALVSLFCFYLFRYYETELFVVLCVIGTYISPIILNKTSDLIFLSGFFLIWAAIFSKISIFLRSRNLVLLASYFGLGAYSFLNIGAINLDDLLIIVFTLILQFIIYTGGVFYYSVKSKKPLSQSEAMAYLPILLFFYGTIYYFLNRYNPQLAPWISLAIAGFIYFLYWKASKEVHVIESQNLVESFFAVVLFHSGYMQIVPASGKPWLLPLIILGVYLSEKKNDHRIVAVQLRIAFSFMAIIEFLNLCVRLISDKNLFNVVPALATIVIGFFYYSKSSKMVKDKEGMFLGLVHVLCVLALYRLAFDHGSFAVSFAWGTYSVAILVFGYTKKNRIIAKSSLLVLTVTCLKALVYDASQAPSGVRIASLILTGVVLYGAGFLFQRINKWTV